MTLSLTGAFFLQALFATFVTVRGKECLSYETPTTSCRTLDSCLGTVCSHVSQGTTTISVQDTCEDPVIVNMVTRDSPHSLPDYRFFVTGGDQRVVDDTSGLRAQFSRNATHLRFTASVLVGDIMELLIPPVHIPLGPASCMCQSTNALPQHLSTPSFLQFSQIHYNCSSDPSCLGVRCTTIVTGNQFSSELYIEPCSEQLRIAGGGGLNQTFANSDTILIPIHYAGIDLNATVQIGITHFNYSMDVEANISVPFVAASGVPILQKQKVILDRSRCPNPTFYPGTSPSYEIVTPGTTQATPPYTKPPYTKPPYTKPSVNPPKTEPHSGSLSKSTVLAIAVAVPVSTILGLGTVVLLVVVVILLYREKKTRGFRFQRMRFRNINQDDEEEEAD